MRQSGPPSAFSLCSCAEGAPRAMHQNGVYWCYHATCKEIPPRISPRKHVRRSVTLPPKIAKQVETLARERDLSDNRVLVELIEQGIEARQQKEKAFFQLAERFRAADDPEQVKQLGNQLGRFVFGD